jgi:D-glycero-D-manno-heptose 1,7-bisphosphate phosphatase
MSQAALFLDRDGVINVDHAYVYRPGDFDFVPGIFELCQYAQEKGYKIIVVTNQAGIGRGYYSENDFHSLTEWMCEEFEKEGIQVLDVFFCPYHPIGGVGSYKRYSDCRKPEPGMILEAQKRHDLSLERSVLVGDKESDIEAGLSAGISTNILFQPNKASEGSKACAVVSRLLDAKKYL